MKLAVFCLLFVLVSAVPFHKRKDSSASLKRKQARVLDLVSMMYLHDPPLDSIKKANSGYKIEGHPSKYNDFHIVENYLKHQKAGHHLPMDGHFNLFNPDHRREAIQLFEVFMTCEDFDIFFHTAAWARVNVNPGLYVYALSVAVLNRPDTDHVQLPPMYEINPYYFTNTKVIQQAYSAKMKQEPAIIDMDFTGTAFNPEQWVAYFGEDIGLNSHHYHWHADFPFWWKPEYEQKKERKGELFFYAHHQLTNRFDHERLSNYLPRVEPLHWDKEIHEGFMPHATYKTEGEFPFRPDDMHFHDLPFVTVNDMKNMDRRIHEAIDLGLLIDSHGDHVSLNNSDGINLLGEIMESSADSKNPHYYGALHNLAHVMLSRVSDPLGKYGLPPGVMEHFETATRDPAFFRLHKYMDDIFKTHKHHLPPYSEDDLSFPGVKINKVEVVSEGHTNELTTFFENFEFDLSNAVATDESRLNIKARVKRLNHKEFTYNIDVHSFASHNAVVRIFLVPTYSFYGEELHQDEKNWLMVELDRFVVKLHPGDNHLHRESTESSVTIPDRMGFSEMWPLLKNNQFSFEDNKRHCGHPHRMLLPKGRVEGMDFTLAVVVTDFEKDKAYRHEPSHDMGNSMSYCGALNGHIPDGRPMGFPFDRHVEDVHELLAHPNMKYEHVTITHHPY